MSYQENGYVVPDFKQDRYINFEILLKSNDIETIAEKILEASYEEVDLLKKDSIDKLLDFAYFKIQTGYVHIENMAYPTRKITDADLENRLRLLINVHLYPEIVLKLLKFFSRNIYDPDSNLYLAELIESEEIIRSIYETFLLFKRDIFKTDPDERSLNVKRIQQFSPRSDNRLSSPLDSASRLKYILEYFHVKGRGGNVFSKDDLSMSKA